MAILNETEKLTSKTTWTNVKIKRLLNTLF